MEEKVILKRPPKSPALAGILSFFLPTTGALYNGQPLKFLIYLVVFAALISMQPHNGQPFPALLLAGFYFYQLFESVQTAKSINRRALEGEEAEDEKKLEEVPQFVKSGSVFWGAVIMGLGFILLAANFGMIGYGTLWDFWPLVIIVIGLKLIVDYLSKEKDES